jgi:hypothetical protein
MIIQKIVEKIYEDITKLVFNILKVNSKRLFGKISEDITKELFTKYKY